MTHDPLCPLPLCDYGSDAEGACYGYGDCHHRCQCNLIAKVRADEQRQAGQRVESLPSGAIPAATAGGAGAEVGW